MNMGISIIYPTVGANSLLLTDCFRIRWRMASTSKNAVEFEINLFRADGLINSIKSLATYKMSTKWSV